MSADRAPRLAVLIDAENVPADAAEALFLEIAKLGEASVRRIYGDFSAAGAAGWRQKLPDFAIMPHQNFAYTRGKNSADIALVIDAMDLLHGGRLDGFCLVSSDGDFTRLASRLREEGLDVYGFGQRHAPEAFRHACKRYFYIENLTAAPSGESGSAPVEDLAAAGRRIARALEGLTGDDGWTTLSLLGARLIEIEPDFDSRTYGSAKLSTLIDRVGGFEIDRSGKMFRLRAKSRKKE